MVYVSRQEEYWERRRLEEERRALRKKRVRTGNPDLPISKSREEKVTGKPCRVCKAQGRHNEQSIEAHHIVHRSRLGRVHPLIHHPDNIMPVCHRHHQDHHNTAKKIPFGVLTAAEQAFVVDQGGDAWSRRWYPRGNVDGRGNMEIADGR